MKQLHLVIILSITILVLSGVGSWLLHEAITDDTRASDELLLENRLSDTMDIVTRAIDALLSHVDTQRPFLPNVGTSIDTSFDKRFQTSAQAIRDIQSVSFVFFVWYKYIDTREDYIDHMSSSRLLNNCTHVSEADYQAFDVVDDELIRYTADTVPIPAVLTFLLWSDGIPTLVGSCGGQREVLQLLSISASEHVLAGDEFRGITSTQDFRGIIDGVVQEFRLATVGSYKPPIYGEISMNIADFMDHLVPSLSDYQLRIVDNLGSLVYETPNDITGISRSKDLSFNTGITWRFTMTQSKDISVVRTRPELVIGLLMAISVIIVVCLFLVMRILNEQSRIAHAKSATRALSASGVHTLGNLFNRIARYAMEIDDETIRDNIMETSGEAGMIMQSVISMSEMIGGVMPVVPILETNLHELAIKIIRGESARAINNLHFALYCVPGLTWTGPMVYFLICFMDMVANARKYSKPGTIVIELAIIDGSLCMEIVNPGALTGSKYTLDLPSKDCRCDRETVVTSRQILSRAVHDAEDETNIDLQYAKIVQMHRCRETQTGPPPIFEDAGILEDPTAIRSSGLGLLNLRLIAARLGGAGGIKEISVAGSTSVQAWCCFPGQVSIVTVNE